MDSLSISPAQARLKLTLLEKNVEAKDSVVLYSEMRNLGLPAEVIEILTRLISATSKIGKKIVAIGKIIVSELLRYVGEHPVQVAGLAAGLYPTYALGGAIHALFTLSPYLSQIKIIGAPLAAIANIVARLCKTAFIPFMIAAPIVGAVSGDMTDKKYPQVSESVRDMALDFFQTFSQIVSAIKAELVGTEESPAFA